ncbi:vitellogenin receptor-like [Linepithema humile]|uniref:vitellogenin receptor-like n=1 Tax=Linepithema humile TaxID=83485 RepID=UPI00351F45FF
MVDQSSYDNTDSNASYFSFRVEHSLSQVGFFSAALIGSCFCFRTKYKACESFFVLQLLITTFGFIAPAMFPGLIVGSATLHTFYIRKKMEMRHRPISQIMCRIAYLLLVCSFLWVSGVEGMFQSVDLYDAFTDEFGNEDYSYYEGSCPKNKFQCTTGSIRCVSNLHQCDVVSDCDDDSDEENCHMGNHVTCANDEFSCQNKKECIPEHKFCDEVFDCTDHSDELVDCQEHLNCTDKFRCNNGFCVRNEWVCDGTKDCTDNSDEINCENKITESECNNTNNRYLCKNKRCVSLKVACDSKDNCGDYSDEGGNCTNTTLCSSVKCQYCKSTPTGPVCFCPPGYKLQENNTCTDIDECQTYGICDQGCENLLGSYNCFCHPNYLLQDNNKTCKYNGAATLVFSTRKNIFLFNPDTEYYTGIMVRNLDHIVDAVINDGYFYWSEVKENENSVIKRVSFDKTREKHETIVTEGLHRVTSLDVDWITGNIYFTDSGYFRIGACNNKGTHCTVLINTDSMLPKLLVLLPTKGLMYYYQEQISIDNEYISKQIKMAGMDGKNMTTFVEPELHVDGLAVDYPSNRLYWLSENGMIESIKLDGTDKRDILHSTVEHAISLAVFENKLYWSDWESKTIQTCDKFSGKDWKTLSHTIEESYRIHIDYPVMKLKFSDPCSPNPCSQLCLLNRNESYTCACSIGQKLNADRHTCLDVKEKPHLVIIAGNTFINYYYELLGKPNVTTNTVSKEISVTEAVYDQLTGTILAIDQYNHYVIRYDPKDGNITNLISIKDMIVGGMAFDYIGNNVYLSNLKHRSIEVHSLTTRKKTIFYFEDEPHSMEIMPTKGIMYVLFKRNIYYFVHEVLMKMTLNGSLSDKREYISTYNSDNPSRLLLRLNHNSNVSTLFANQKFVITNLPPLLFKSVGIRFMSIPEVQAFSFDVTEDSIFWTERNSKLLHRMNRNGPNFYKQVVLTMPVDKVENPHVINVRGMVIHKKEGCLQNNGNCSHVCLPSSLQSFMCACPPRMVLGADKRTCIVSTGCPMHKIKCSEHDVCIKPEQWCDGHKDCPNGEDEESNCKERGICEEDEFMCDDHTCINEDKHCDFFTDCVDDSDEKHCFKIQCNKGEYRCRRGGECISRFAVCDGNYDCPDFSDELHCDNYTCSSDEFMCDMGKCIPKDWKCDDEFDCPDGSDEAGHCYLKSICGPDYYKCANGRCISNSLQCNHINDCGDDSDEKYCTRYGYSRNCTENEYLCMNSGICVSKKAKCNGIQDCPRNDDEFYCAYCFEDEFTCDNQKCIGKHLVCNNVDDCGDNSEETDCRNNKKNIENCDQFKCTSGTCLSFDKVCDGINDCPDGSDEYGNCSLACQNAKCEDMCQNRPHGAVCSCRPGYSLDSNGKSCNDINECLQNVCSQNCLNTVGSYICECLSIYSLRTDKVSCKAIGPQMHFITTTGDDIRNISADVGSVELVHHLAGFSISSIDSNALDDALYWSSEEEGTINKMNVKTKKILTMGNFTPKAIAVDWVTNNVYFNDNNRRNVIKVCNLEQLKCAVIVEIKDMAKVTALAVDPILGYLFWSHTTWHSHDKPIAEIYRTNLMGADMKKIVFRNISVVSGMAIDQLKFKLYWSDSYFKTIESANYEGDGRTTFLNTDICRPASINIFEDSIYWLMASTGQLQKCKLYGDKACTTIDIGTHNIHRHFTIFHTVNHPNVVENFCKIEHCDYMCVLNHSIIDLLDEHIESFVTCICQDGKPVKPNTICPKNANEDIAFVSTHTCHNGGICSIIIIMILIVGALFGVYYLYQKYKLKLGVLDLNIINSFDRIRFQNPLFDRRDEVTVNTVTFNSTASSNIFPGQHEYMNPVTEELSEN